MPATLPRYSGPERRTSSHNYPGVERRSASRLMAQGTESRAKFLGHPLHQQLVVFPLGLLATAVIFDVIYLISEAPVMAVVSFWMIVAGLVGGIIATPFGLWDWMEIPEGTRAKTVGMVHGIGNVAVMALFLLSVLGRINDEAAPPAFAFALAWAGGALALITGWLGGELVSRLGIGVSPDAGPDASSSLRKH
ncbi:MAG: hypothetical protein JWP47_648 [Polaromonas sp.]|nr:hypothetical protein [Polaromonas sp.]